MNEANLPAELKNLEVKYSLLLDRFIRMCKQHPDICPHEPAFIRTERDSFTDELFEVRKCIICGKEVRTPLDNKTEFECSHH